MANDAENVQEDLSFFELDINYLSGKDILLGRFYRSWNHEGNRRYRYIILKNQSQYHGTKKRSMKSFIATNVLNQLIKEGYRFLKEDDKKVNVWHEVERKICIEKVYHSLRCKRKVSRSIFSSLEQNSRNDLNDRTQEGNLTLDSINNGIDEPDNSSLERTSVYLHKQRLDGMTSSYTAGLRPNFTSQDKIICESVSKECALQKEILSLQQQRKKILLAINQIQKSQNESLNILSNTSIGQSFSSNSIDFLTRPEMIISSFNINVQGPLKRIV